jgi:hypothetical protein
MLNEQVTGQWGTADGLMSDSCTTTNDGGCSFNLSGIKNREKSLLFSVTSHQAGEGPDSIAVNKP